MFKEKKQTLNSGSQVKTIGGSFNQYLKWQISDIKCEIFQGGLQTLINHPKVLPTQE